MKHKKITKSTYELFIDHEFYLENYLEKVHVIRSFLGNSMSINLLSPGNFLCPVKNCREVINLKHFNDYGYIKNHLITHKVDNVHGADVLVDRLIHVSSADWNKANKFEALDNVVESLNTTSHEGKSLSLDHISLFLPSPSDSFKGKSQMMDEAIIQQLVDFDTSALDSMPDPPTNTINNYFQRAAARK